MKQINVHVIQ